MSQIDFTNQTTDYCRNCQTGRVEMKITDVRVFRSTIRTASSVRPTARTCRPAPSPMLPWCTRSHPSTPCSRGLPGPPPCLPAQVRHTCRQVQEVCSCSGEHCSDVSCILIGRSLHPGQPIPSLLQPQQPAVLPPDTQPRSHALLQLRAHWHSGQPGPQGRGPLEGRQDWWERDGVLGGSIQSN